MSLITANNLPPAPAIWRGRVVLLVLGLALAGCTSATTAPQKYPTLQPIDQLLAEADSAFSGPAP